MNFEVTAQKNAAPAHIVIEPQRGWVNLELRDLWRYRDLLFLLTWRDIKVRYAQTALGEVLQAATGVETSILDLAQMALEVAGRKVNVEHGPIRQGDIRKNYSSTQKIEKVLGRQPQVRLMERLRQTWTWLSQHQR